MQIFLINEQLFAVFTGGCVVTDMKCIDMSVTVNTKDAIRMMKGLFFNKQSDNCTQEHVSQDDVSFEKQFAIDSSPFLSGCLPFTITIKMLPFCTFCIDFMSLPVATIVYITITIYYSVLQLILVLPSHRHRG